MAKVQVTETPLETTGGKIKKANEFLPVIASFNDGKARLITPDAGESLATLLDQLRAAARTIGRSVSVNWLDAKGVLVKFEKGKSVPAGAVSFKFALRDLITRKATTEGGDDGSNAAPVPPAPTEPATPTPPTAATNRNKRK